MQPCRLRSFRREAAREGPQSQNVPGGAREYDCRPGTPANFREETSMQETEMGGYEAQHFRYVASGNIATITLNRPDRKNPLTFEAYDELGTLFRKLARASDIKAVVFTGEGGNFCSGGDVHEIIGPLVAMDMPGLLRFTRMTGELVKAMRACPQPIVAAIDGVCTGAGAMIALFCDIRLGTPQAKT